MVRMKELHRPHSPRKKNEKGGQGFTDVKVLQFCVNEVKHCPEVRVNNIDLMPVRIKKKKTVKIK